MSPAGRWSRWRPNRTLRGRLTVGLAVILLAACAVLGAATALFLRAFLLAQLDNQLAAAGGRFSASLEHGQLAPGGDDGDADNAVPGQSVGTIGIRLVGGRVTQAAEVSEDGARSADEAGKR
jgi:two-component system OmpR family sensor kinase